MLARLGLSLLLCSVSSLVAAECVEGALLKSKFSRLNVHTIALTGGYGDSIVIRTSCKIKRNSSIGVLKDTFCSASEAVLLIDGEECGADQVHIGDKITENRLFDTDEWDYPVD